MSFWFYAALIVSLEVSGSYVGSGVFHPMNFYSPGEPLYQDIDHILCLGFIYNHTLNMLRQQRMSRRSRPLTSWQMAYNDNKKYGSRKAELAKLLYNYKLVIT